MFNRKIEKVTDPSNDDPQNPLPERRGEGEDNDDEDDPMISYDDEPETEEAPPPKEEPKWKGL